MTTQTAVAFDENAIGASLALTVGDSTLQTSATVDAHRCARSQYGQASDVSFVEFYVYPANGGTPSLAPVSGVPPLTVGICTSQASLSKYCGEDAYGWGYCPGDGNVYNNGAIVKTLAPAPLNTYITVSISPLNGTLAFSANGMALGNIILTPGTFYYAATVSGNPGDLAIWANAGQSPQKYPIPNSSGWLHKTIGILPLNLATEPYITPPTDTAPNVKYNGDVDRMRNPTTIQRAVKFWPWGASMPPGLSKGGQSQIEILDPNEQYGELIAMDIRDQDISLSRTPQGGSADTAETVATLIMDHCQQQTDQTKTLYCNDKLTLLQSQLYRPLFPPNADPSVAGKPRPIAWGVCRTFTPALYDAVNFYYAIGDAPISQVGFPRINGAPMQPGTYSLTTDLQGVDLTAAPDGKFTIETSTYTQTFSIAANDFLAGLGAFGSIATTGTPKIPNGWTEAHARYGSYFPTITGWQITGTAPNQVLQAENYGNQCGLTETTYKIKAGRSYAFQIVVSQAPKWGTYATGLPDTPYAYTDPATLVMGYTSASPVMFESNFTTISVPNSGTYMGVFTNTTGADQNFVLGFLCNFASSHSSYIKISSIYLNELPPYTYNIPLIGPGLDLSLQAFMLQRGPLTSVDYDPAGAQAIDAATGYQYGLHIGENDTPTVQACAQKLLDSCCADVFVSRAGKVSTLQLTAPENAASVAGSLTVTDIQGYLQPYPDLAENLTTRLSGCQNYNPLSESDFANVSLSAVPLSQRKALEATFQWTVTGGVKLASRYRAAESAQPLPSQFDREQDGQAAITAVCNLYAQPRNFYVGTFFSPIGRGFEIGQVWNLAYPLAGLETGRQLLIVGIADQPSEDLATVTFWGL